jgi:hypothetical protein
MWRIGPDLDAFDQDGPNRIVPISRRHVLSGGRVRLGVREAVVEHSKVGDQAGKP